MALTLTLTYFWKNLNFLPRGVLVPLGQDPNLVITADMLDTVNSRAEAGASRLAELNPYVTVNTLTTGVSHDTDLSYLLNYQVSFSTYIMFNTCSYGHIWDSCQSHVEGWIQCKIVCIDIVHILKYCINDMYTVLYIYIWHSVYFM